MLLVAVRAFVIFSLVATVVGEEGTDIPPTKGLKVFVANKGARIELRRELAQNASTGKITIRFLELREVNANGSQVSGQSGGKGKHAFNAFSNQDFTAIRADNVTLEFSNGSVRADCVRLQATLTDALSAQFEAQVCTAKSSGTLYLGDENSTVADGQLKFTVKVQNWNFSADGAALELDINVMIPPGQNIKDEGSSGAKRPKKFNFGAGAYAEFSSQVRTDGVWKSMGGSGFPKYDNTGANNRITIRLPRFNQTADYDPTFEAGSNPAASSAVLPKGSFTLQSSVLVVFFSLAGLSWFRL